MHRQILSALNSNPVSFIQKAKLYKTREDIYRIKCTEYKGNQENTSPPRSYILENVYRQTINTNNKLVYISIKSKLIFK